MSIIWQRTNVWLDVDSLTRQALIDRARQASTEVDAVDAAQLLSTGAIAVDVRETEEIAEGLLKDAVVIPRGFLELRIEGKVPNRNQPLVVYCASGVRSLLATWTLRQMGYPKAVSLIGGFDGWKAAGRPWVVPQQLTSE
ncbi:MAG: rhodanese-like domain-containing protein, partial [Myxococcota bacterium]